jgi:transposase
MTISDSDVEVLTQPERRRRWSVEQKLAMVAEMMRPGASASRVARRHGITTGLLYTWRRLAAKGVLSLTPAVAAPGFVPVRVTPEACDREPAQAGNGDRAGVMVIELGGERRVRVDRHVDAAALRRVLEVLDRR